METNIQQYKDSIHLGIVCLGGEYIRISDGQPATDKEVTEFKRDLAKLKQHRKQEKQKIKEEKEKQRKDFQRQHYSAIVEFFGEDKLEYDIDCEEELLHQLATALFDRQSGHAHETLDELKRLFPNHWIQALERFYLGRHDT